MAGKKLQMDVDITTSNAQKNVKAAAKETGNLADALKAVADVAEAQMAEISSASAAMAAALGDDFVKARAAAGQSVEQITLGLHEMGGSFDEIRNDAGRLADEVKRLDGVRTSIDGVGVSAKKTAGEFDRVRDSADQSRSVLANATGNSLADMAALAGVTGTAGQVLSQFGEYAAEGNISLSGLAKVAGPLAALTVVTWGVSAAIKAAGQSAKDAKEETERYMKINQLLKDQKVDEAAEELRQQWEKTIPIIKEMGFTEADLVDTLRGKGTMLEQLRAEQALNNEELAENTFLTDAQQVALNGENVALGNLITNLEQGQANTKAAADQQRDLTQTTTALASALSADGVNGLRSYSDAADAARSRIKELAETHGELADALAEGKAALAESESFNAMQAAVVAMNDAISHTPGDIDAINSATLGAKASMLSLLESTALIDEPKKLEIVAMINRGELSAAENAINVAFRDRLMNVTIRVDTQVGAGRSYSDRADEARTNPNKVDIPIPKVSSGGGGGGGSSGGGGGSSAAEDAMAEYDRLAKFFFDTDQWTLDEYRKYLQGRLGAYKEFSKEWEGISRDIIGLNDKEADAAKKAADEITDAMEASAEVAKKAAEDMAKALEKAADEAQANADRTADAKYEFGEMPLEEYKAYLQQRLQAFDKYSVEGINRRRQLIALDKEQAAAIKAVADAEAERNKPLQGAEGIRDAITQQFIINYQGAVDANTVQLLDFYARRQRQALRAGVGTRI
jgi:hypothetical protein